MNNSKVLVRGTVSNKHQETVYFSQRNSWVGECSFPFKRSKAVLPSEPTITFLKRPVFIRGKVSERRGKSSRKVTFFSS